ncbi:MAG: hypothetical protein P4L64_10095 [Caulobacteraceae bacterium]|nr:hypothetical protein [Caulobacteraceae bacterium]
MTVLFALVLSATAPTLVDHPKTYLASITGIPLKPGERIKGFSISTWGVTFSAVCQIPPGWTIKAGGSATPEGVLNGEASLGTTWLSQPSPKPLHDLILLTLVEPVQRRDVGKVGGPVYIPATFKGKARLDDGDRERKVSLNYANIQLTPALGCPVATP